MPLENNDHFSQDASTEIESPSAYHELAGKDGGIGAPLMEAEDAYRWPDSSRGDHPSKKAFGYKPHSRTVA